MKKIPPFVKNNKIYLGGKKKTKEGGFYLVQICSY